MTYPVSIEGAHDACVFLGNVYGRRARILDKLRARLGARLRVVSDAFCYGDSYYAPAASSAAKLATLAGARVVVNIKPVEPALTCTETPRLWWCVANRVFVVSETDNDAEARAPFEEAGLVFARTSDELVEAVVEIMSEPRERTRARAENALAYARRRCAFGKSLLVATGEHSSS